MDVYLYHKGMRGNFYITRQKLWLIKPMILRVTVIKGRVQRSVLLNIFQVDKCDVRKEKEVSEASQNYTVENKHAELVMLKIIIDIVDNHR